MKPPPDTLTRGISLFTLASMCVVMGLMLARPLAHIGWHWFQVGGPPSRQGVAAPAADTVSWLQSKLSEGPHTVDPAITTLPWLDLGALDTIVVSDGQVRVGAGAHWKAVVETLRDQDRSLTVVPLTPDPVGWSLLQDMHDGRLLADSVEGLTLLTGAGEVISCTREMEWAVCRHALSSRGEGVLVLDAVLKTVPDAQLEEETWVGPLDALAPHLSPEGVGTVLYTPSPLVRWTRRRERETPPKALPLLFPGLRRAVVHGAADQAAGTALRVRLEELYRSARPQALARSSIHRLPVYVGDHQGRDDRIDLLVPRDSVLPVLRSIPAALPTESRLVDIRVRAINTASPDIRAGTWSVAVRVLRDPADPLVKLTELAQQHGGFRWRGSPQDLALRERIDPEGRLTGNGPSGR